MHLSQCRTKKTSFRLVSRTEFSVTRESRCNSRKTTCRGQTQPGESNTWSLSLRDYTQGMALVSVVRALRAAHLVGVHKALSICRGLLLSPHWVNCYCKDVVIGVDLYPSQENLFILSFSPFLFFALALALSFTHTHTHTTIHTHTHLLHLEGKPRTPLSSRVATRVSWSPLSGLKGVQPPLPFGERTRDCSPGHAGEEGPQLARTGASQGFPRAAAPVGVFSRGILIQPCSLITIGVCVCVRKRGDSCVVATGIQSTIQWLKHRNGMLISTQSAHFTVSTCHLKKKPKSRLPA